MLQGAVYNKVNGFYNVNKQEGYTSRQIVNKIAYILKKEFGIKKAGHLGTLDPMATGVLPIAVGNCTRFFEYSLNKNKTYNAVFEFGYDTDTYDRDGVVVNKTLTIPTLNQIENIMPSFLGIQKQIPPEYSAKSINGVRAYKLAREGIKVELKPAEIEIQEIKILAYTNDRLELKIVCSSGTYIRSICRDMAIKLNSLATMISLIRIKSGKFVINESHTIEEIESSPEKLLVSSDFLIENMETKIINESEYKRLMYGQEIHIGNGEDIALYFDGVFIGYGCNTSGGFKFKVRL